MTTKSSVIKRGSRSAERYLIYFEIFLIIIAPILVLQLGIVNVEYRIHTFGVFFLFAFVSIRTHRIDLKDLGIRLDNIKRAMSVIGGQAIILSIWCVIILGSLSSGVVRPTVSNVLPPLVYIFISCPIQQFICYGYLYPRLKAITDNKLVLAVAMGGLFGIMHIPWDSGGLTLLAFVVGIWWGVLYTRYPNLFAAISSHMLVGGIALTVV